MDYMPNTEPDSLPDKECLIDVDNFNLKKYLIYLYDPLQVRISNLKNFPSNQRKQPLEAKDEFPFVVIYVYFGVVLYKVVEAIKRKFFQKKTINVEVPQNPKGTSLFGMGERQSMKFSFDKFEQSRDKILRKMNRE